MENNTSKSTDSFLTEQIKKTSEQLRDCANQIIDESRVNNKQNTSLEEYSAMLTRITRKWENDNTELDEMRDKISNAINKNIKTDKNFIKTGFYQHYKEIQDAIVMLKEDNQKKIKRYSSTNQNNKEYLNDIANLLFYEFRQSEQAFVILKETVLHAFMNHTQKLNLDKVNGIKETVSQLLNETKPKEDIFDKISNFRKKLFGDKKDNQNNIK